MKAILKVIIMILVVSSISLANTNHINYIMNTNKNLSEEQAEKLYKKFKTYTNKYDVDIELALAVASVESKFRETAESVAGAYGIMQIMDITSKHYDKNRKNLDENIEIGVLHLNDSLKAFGKTDNAIASYNAGISRIKTTNYKNIPETRFYVAKVKQELEKLKYKIKVDKAREMQTIKEVVKKSISKTNKIKFNLGEDEKQQVEENEEVGTDETGEEEIEQEQSQVEEKKEEKRGLGFKLGGLGMLPNSD